MVRLLGVAWVNVVPVPIPEPPRPALDLGAVGPSLWGSRWQVEVVEESPSTNAALVDLVRDGAASTWSVLVAEHQTRGRGRLDRTWVTPPRAALTFSLVAPLAAVPAKRWGWLPLLAGVAVVRGLERAGTTGARLKWPNDVVWRDAKLAGLLVEVVTKSDEHRDGPVAVVGIGLNVSTTAQELPVDTATSLWLTGAAAPDRSSLLPAILEAFGEEHDRWAGGEGTTTASAYRSLSATVGREVRVDLPGGERVHGRARDVDVEGRLVLDTASGPRVLGAGDVVHVRAAPGADMS